jgi:hypothetical protein
MGRGEGQQAAGWDRSSWAWKEAMVGFPDPPYALGLTDPALVS